MPRTLVPDPANSQSANNAPRILSQQVYPLHRLVLSRSPYFSVLMRGPWKDATSPTLTLEIEDPMVDEAAIEVALGFLYEKVPEELTPELATRTLAAASFLDLQDLCEMCVDVIVNDIRTETLSEYVKLTTLNQYKTVHDDLLGPDYTRNDKTTSPYGKHSDKIRDACWGYMCQNCSNILQDEHSEKYGAWWSVVTALNLGLVEHLFCSDELHVKNEFHRSAMIVRTGGKILERIMRGEYHDECGDEEHVHARCVRFQRLVELLKKPSSDEPVTCDEEVPDRVKYQCLKVLVSVVYMKSKVQHEHVEDSDIRSMDFRFKCGPGLRFKNGFPLLKSAKDSFITSDEEVLRWLEGVFKINAGDLIRLLCLDLGMQTSKESFYDSFNVRKEFEQRAVESLMHERLSIAARSLPPAAADETGAETAARRLGDMGLSGSGDTLTELTSHEDSICGKHELNMMFDRLRPFRFGVEFPNILNLTDGQARHSHEFFYAGSLWKVSVQAFTDEDPKHRRTLGLFLHRRRGEEDQSQPTPTPPPVQGETVSHSDVALDAALRQSTSPGNSDKRNYRGATPYCDDRDTVAVRYALVCPSKAETVTLGSLEPTTRHTVLPRSPKGWGWRTAMLFSDLRKMVDEDGALRIIAIIRLVAEP